MKCFFVGTVLLALTMGIVVRGQEPSPAATNIPKSISEAERDGELYPHGEPASSPGPGFETGGAEGTSLRKCVEFPSGIMPANRRSGEFIVGGEIGALKAGKDGKVWWAPLHDPGSAKSTLIVRNARIDGSETNSVFTSKNYAWPIRADSTPDREHAFYPTGFTLPEKGRWLLTATSGSDWGCFVVTVQ